MNFADAWHYFFFPALRLSAPAGCALTRVLLLLGLVLVDLGVPLNLAIGRPRFTPVGRSAPTAVVVIAETVAALAA